MYERESWMCVQTSLFFKPMRIQIISGLAWKYNVLSLFLDIDSPIHFKSTGFKKRVKIKNGNQLAKNIIIWSWWITLVSTTKWTCLWLSRSSTVENVGFYPTNGIKGKTFINRMILLKLIIRKITFKNL